MSDAARLPDWNALAGLGEPSGGAFWLPRGKVLALAPCQGGEGLGVVEEPGRPARVGGPLAPVGAEALELRGGGEVEAARLRGVVVHHAQARELVGQLGELLAHLRRAAELVGLAARGGLGAGAGVLAVVLAVLLVILFLLLRRVRLLRKIDAALVAPEGAPVHAL